MCRHAAMRRSFRETYQRYPSVMKTPQVTDPA